jgi:hypothetical protein
MAITNEPREDSREARKGIWGWLYYFMGPPLPQGQAISAHSPEGIAYRERERAARRQARERRRKG